MIHLEVDTSMSLKNVSAVFVTCRVAPSVMCHPLWLPHVDCRDRMIYSVGDINLDDVMWRCLAW